MSDPQDEQQTPPVAIGKPRAGESSVQPVAHLHRCDEKYVCLSTEGQTVAVVHFVVAAMQMWKESDTVRIHHESGDVIITGDMAKRILEVNQMAGELLRMMREAGEDEAA